MFLLQIFILAISVLVMKSSPVLRHIPTNVHPYLWKQSNEIQPYILKRTFDTLPTQELHDGLFLPTHSSLRMGSAKSLQELDARMIRSVDGGNAFYAPLESIRRYPNSNPGQRNLYNDYDSLSQQFWKCYFNAVSCF